MNGYFEFILNVRGQRIIHRVDVHSASAYSQALSSAKTLYPDAILSTYKYVDNRQEKIKQEMEEGWKKQKETAKLEAEQGKKRADAIDQEWKQKAAIKKIQEEQKAIKKQYDDLQNEIRNQKRREKEQIIREH